MAIDNDKLNAFLGRFVGNLGATLHAGMVMIGGQLGLYKALAPAPLEADELARITGTDPRYVLEWLSSQAAGGYVEYDAATMRFSMTEEQALALATEGSPAFIPGAFQLATAALLAVPRITAAFRSGVGLVFYSTSTLICTPASRAQEVGMSLGAQAGEARLRDVVTKGGFTRFRCATQTPST